MPVPVINNPCPEKWDGMAPDEQGRFCGKCSKIVIDFTKKTTQEIVDFLNARKGEDICGKLRKPALVPVSTSTTLSLTNGHIRTFLAALYLAFGSLLFTSCGPTEDEEPVGKVGLDSAAQAENQRYLDSMMRADSITKLAKDSGTLPMDTSVMIQTMNVIDSLMKVKNR